MVNRNSVEQIQIQVDKDIAAGLYDDLTGAAIVAQAVEQEQSVEPTPVAPTPTPEPEPTVSRMLTPEPAPEPTPAPTPAPDEPAPIEPSSVVAEEEVFDPIPTEAEIVQRVALERRETAEENLAPYFEFDPDGIVITGVRIDEAIDDGARSQD